jgi:small subunit ribosomal protein S20
MANHLSSKKRAVQSEKARERNRAALSIMKNTVKKVKEALAKNDLATLDAVFKEAQSVIAKTRRAGGLHANNVARRISKLAKAVNKAKGTTAPEQKQPVKATKAPKAPAKTAKTAKAKKA